MPRPWAASPAAIRAILCLRFDRRAAPVEVAKFRSNLLGCEEVVHSIDAEGDFDFMVEIEVPGIGDVHAFLGRFAAPLADIASERRLSFVSSRRSGTRHAGTGSLWVPVRSGLMRLPTREINRISAEGDYVRLHTDEASYLYHSTMAALEASLDPAHFVRLHRSSIVRIDFVLQLIHRDQRWFALLGDWSLQRVAKGHVAKLRARTLSSSIANVGSPTISPSDDAMVTVVETAKRTNGGKRIVPPSPIGEMEEGEVSCSPVPN